MENDAPEAPQPARDRELSRFRAAHDLHFAGNRPREAIQAYAEYLREYPNGRFVPEARYNGALDQIKLGNQAAAREALAPFAAGRFDGYRQKEARELLDALDRQASGSKR
jgi:TolA-binding protein